MRRSRVFGPPLGDLGRCNPRDSGGTRLECTTTRCAAAHSPSAAHGWRCSARHPHQAARSFGSVPRRVPRWRSQLPAALDRQAHDLLGRVAIGTGAFLESAPRSLAPVGAAVPPPRWARRVAAAEANTLRSQVSASRRCRRCCAARCAGSAPQGEVLSSSASILSRLATGARAGQSRRPAAPHIRACAAPPATARSAAASRSGAAARPRRSRQSPR